MFVLRKQNFILAVDFNPLEYPCLENPHGQRKNPDGLQSMGLQRVGHD